MPGMMEQQWGQLGCGEKMTEGAFHRDCNFSWVETRPEGSKGRNILIEGLTRSKLSNEVVGFWIL